MVAQILGRTSFSPLLHVLLGCRAFRRPVSLPPSAPSSSGCVRSCKTNMVPCNHKAAGRRVGEKNIRIATSYTPGMGADGVLRGRRVLELAGFSAFGRDASWNWRGSPWARRTCPRIAGFLGPWSRNWRGSLLAARRSPTSGGNIANSRTRPLPSQGTSPIPGHLQEPDRKGARTNPGPTSTHVEKNYAMALLTIAAKLSATREAPPTSAPSTSSFSRKPAMFSGLAEPP